MLKKKLKKKRSNEQKTFPKLNEDDKKLHFPTLPHHGLKGQHIINKIQKNSNKIQTCYIGRRLNTFFQIKDGLRK